MINPKLRRSRAAEASPSIHGRRVKPTSAEQDVTGNEPTVVTAEPSISFTPVEQHLSEKASISQDAGEREAVRRESRLVREFVSHLEARGHEVSGVVVAVGRELIRADLFDQTANVLYEAKAAADRLHIRMAIGQLLDYRRFIPSDALSVLVPVRPADDLCHLLFSLGIGVTWPNDSDWCELEPTSPR